MQAITRGALQHAASVAGLMIAELPKDEAPSGGGMGGMM
jgi:chaperonin GroEL